MKKAKTIKLKGKDYATVPERLRLFREDCPYGLIVTTPTITDKTVLFRVRVLKDKSNEHSAEATGHAFGEMKDDKAFEKLETVALGRALANLGYLASGEIASAEEMEEFYNSRTEKAMRIISSINTLEELKAYYFDNKGKGFDSMITERKQELTQK